jgi:hypothetical protein
MFAAYIAFVCLIGFYVTRTQYRSYRDVPAVLVEEGLRTSSVHYSGKNGHLSTCIIPDVPWASWIVSSHERIQSPCRDSNPQRWGASDIYHSNCKDIIKWTYHVVLMSHLYVEYAPFDNKKAYRHDQASPEKNYYVIWLYNSLTIYIKVNAIVVIRTPKNASNFLNP